MHIGLLYDTIRNGYCSESEVGKMRVAYRKQGNTIELIRIWSFSEVVEVPENIDGCPVTSIASYAFSSHKWEKDEDVLIYEEACENGSFRQEAPLRCGGNVKEVHLPPTVRAIGNYAFYGCINMEVFHGTDRIVRMGSGVFTGCRLSQVWINFYEGEKSCLKEILTDIRYGITATLVYGNEKIRIVFPEYYADAVENTPARIVETHYYGSGGDYRECFYRRELDFAKYDETFALSAARDQGEVTACVALGRLMYPYRLREKAERIYHVYVKEHMTQIMGYCLEYLEENRELSVGEPMEIIEFCCRKALVSEESLEYGIERAAQSGQTELLSILMDERQKRFPKKKKEFIL